MSDRESLGRLVRETWVAWAGEQPDAKPGWLTGWDELDAGQREVDMRIGEAVAAAAVASHEHTWVRCEKCLSDGPCPCSGGICCPGEQREIEERAEGAADARDRIIEVARKMGAVYPATLQPPPGSEGSVRRASFPFADYLEDVPAERQGDQI